MAAASIEVKPQPDDSVFKPALVLMSGRTMAFAATFFIPIVLARILSPAQFGTYKQLFLVWGTVYYIAQLGMASSLYYFLPRTPRSAGAFAANAMCFLGTIGIISCAGIWISAPAISRWLSNQELTAYLHWIGLYVFLMMLSTALEIVLISRGKYLWAATTYAASDLVRASAFIVPVLLFHNLEWLLRGAVSLAFVRAAVTFIYFRREFGREFRPDAGSLKMQLSYALPFGLAVVVEILQANLPQYAVSHLFDPATLAIFAVGCLQIPLVDFAASPTSDVMMVKMQERLAEGRTRAVLDIWHDTTWKLALLFVPLTAFVMADAREIIVLLYTPRYLASVPIFLMWSVTILLTILQVDGVLRVFAETRLLLILNLMRLAIIGGLLKFALSDFHLVGGAMVPVAATLLFKAVGLIRFKRLMQIGVSELLPWRALGGLFVAAGSGVVAVLVVKEEVHLPSLPLIALTGIVFTVIYVTLTWSLGLLKANERLAIVGWLRRARLVTEA